MYFTNTPALNSMEAIMKKLPYGTQKGGGRLRRLYQYTKKDCDCRLCLYYRKKNGCTLTLCPVLEIRLGCGAATIGDFQRRPKYSIPKTPVTNIPPKG